MRNSILIFGILILCVAVALVTFLALSATGLIAAEPIALTVKVRSVTEPYDANPHRASAFDIAEGELLNGHTIEALSYTGELVGVGDCDSGMTLRVIDEDGYDVSVQYKIRIVPGTITVTPRTITVNQANVSADYTGEAVINDRFSVLEENGLCEGHRLEVNPLDKGVTAPTSRPIAGEYEPVIFDAAGNNVTANYDMAYTSGTVTVRKRLLTIAPVSVERVYNGKPLAPENYTIISGSLMEGHEITGVEWEFDGETDGTGITNVGSARVRVRGISLRNAEANEFYTVMSTSATVTVTPKPVVIEGKSKTWRYVKPLLRAENAFGIQTGEIDTDENSGTYKYYTLKKDKEPKTSAGIVDGDILKLTYSAAINDVGEKSNDFTYTISRSKTVSGSVVEEDVSGNYTVSAIAGTLKVEPRTIKIDLNELIAANAEQVYNGKVHDITQYLEGAALNGTGLSKTDFEPTEEIKNARVYSASVRIKDERIARNYNLEVTEGRYEVKKALLPNFSYGKEKTLSKVYDGKPAVFDCLMAEFVVDESIPEDKRMPEIYFASAVLAEKHINAGIYESQNIVNAVIRDKETGENVTANYDISQATVKVEIQKRKITVTAKALTVSQDFYLEEVSSEYLLGQLQIISGSLAEGDSFSGTALKAESEYDTYTITGYVLDKDNYEYNDEATGLWSVIGNTDA
ncbi:hypothetical protein [Pumilibacter intestinalis]|uniref:hypothetical protein n=1 Tax=Pumilibacter intestinalis TaxID=2941511 RepID=UPI00203E3A59|nr:hypothetical protein [Pumilibacter intestinalis]